MEENSFKRRKVTSFLFSQTTRNNSSTPSNSSSLSITSSGSSSTIIDTLSLKLTCEIDKLSKSINETGGTEIEFYKRGINYLDSGAFLEAINDFSRALFLNRNNSFTYAKRAIAYFRLNKVDKAINDLNQARNIDQNNDSFLDLSIKCILYHLLHPSKQGIRTLFCIVEKFWKNKNWNKSLELLINISNLFIYLHSVIFEELTENCIENFCKFLGHVWVRKMVCEDLKIQDRKYWSFQLSCLVDRLTFLKFENASFTFKIASEIASEGWANPNLKDILSGKVEFEELLSQDNGIDPSLGALEPCLEEGNEMDILPSPSLLGASSPNFSYTEGALSISTRILYLQEQAKFGECNNLVHWLQFNFYKFTKSKDLMTLAKTIKRLNPVCSFVMAMSAIVNGTFRTNNVYFSPNSARKRNFSELDEESSCLSPILSHLSLSSSSESIPSNSSSLTTSPTPSSHSTHYLLTIEEKQKISLFLLDHACQNLSYPLSNPNLPRKCNSSSSGNWMNCYDEFEAFFFSSDDSNLVGLNEPLSLIQLASNAVAKLIFDEQEGQWNPCMHMFLSIPALHLQQRIMFDLSLLFCKACMNPPFLLTCARTLVSWEHQEEAVKLALNNTSHIISFSSFAENMEAVSYFLNLSRTIHSSLHLKLAQALAAKIENSVFLNEIAKMEYTKNSYDSGYFFAHKLFHQSDPIFKLQSSYWLLDSCMKDGNVNQMHLILEKIEPWTENYIRFLFHFLFRVKNDPLVMFWLEELQPFFLKPLIHSTINPTIKDLILELGELSSDLALEMAIQFTRFWITVLTPKTNYLEFRDWIKTMHQLFLKSKSEEKWNEFYQSLLLTPSIKRKTNLHNLLVSLEKEY